MNVTVYTIWQELQMTNLKTKAQLGNRVIIHRSPASTVCESVLQQYY